MTDQNEKKPGMGFGQGLPGSPFDSLSNRLAQFSGGRPHTGRSAGAPAMDESDPSDDYFLKPAGKMLIGSPIPTPDFSHDELEDAVKRNQVFSSTNKGSGKRLSTGRAVASLCILAAGSAIALTAYMDPAAVFGNTQKRSERLSQTTERAALASDNEDSRLENSRASSSRPVASVLAFADESNTEIIRLAQNETGRLSLQDAAGDAGEKIPLKVLVDRIDGQEYAFVMFRGLPDDFALSSGFRVKQSWAVSLTDLDGLTLEAPDGYTGRLELEVLLVKGRNSPVESRTMSVNIGTVSPVVTATIDTAADPTYQIPSVVPPYVGSTKIGNAGQQDRASVREFAPSVESKPRKPLIDQHDEEVMLEKAVTLLSNGDVISARLLLNHMAKNGSGKGALALAQTFDPKFFDTINALGAVKPSLEEARKWYSIAAELGQDVAKDRLSALSGQ